MKFPRKIHVDGYEKVTVEPSGPFTVALSVEDNGVTLVNLELYASESKALRKALKAAEAGLTLPYHQRNTFE
jgi:hypothetical protein